MSGKDESKAMPSPKSVPKKVQIEDEVETVAETTTTTTTPANNIFTDAAREALPTDNQPALDRALHDEAADMSRRATATEAQSSLRDSVASLVIDADDHDHRRRHPRARSLPGPGLQNNLQNLSDEELRALADNLSRVLGESFFGPNHEDPTRELRADVLRRLLALGREGASPEDGFGGEVAMDGADSSNKEEDGEKKKDEKEEEGCGRCA